MGVRKKKCEKWIRDLKALHRIVIAVVLSALILIFYDFFCLYISIYILSILNGLIIHI